MQVLHGGGDGGEVKMRAEGRRHERVEESKEEESMGISLNRNVVDVFLAENTEKWAAILDFMGCKGATNLVRERLAQVRLAHEKGRDPLGKLGCQGRSEGVTDVALSSPMVVSGLLILKNFN